MSEYNVLLQLQLPPEHTKHKHCELYEFIPVLCSKGTILCCCVSGPCGSCYSFATMGMLESRVRILTNNSQTPILSPQQVVSCSEYSQGKTHLFPEQTNLCHVKIHGSGENFHATQSWKSVESTLVLATVSKQLFLGKSILTD